MWAHCASFLPLFDRHLIAVAAADDVLQGEHSQESLLQPILMTSLSLPAASASANSAVAAASNIGKSGSHFDKPLNTSAAAAGSTRRDRRGHGGCARSRIGKRNDEPSFLVKLYEEPQRLFMARSEADIFNGAPLTASTESQCTLWPVTILRNCRIHTYALFRSKLFFCISVCNFFFCVNCNRSISTFF